MKPYRFHILAVPHAVTCKEYSSCAFTSKILKMARMLTDRGHYVIHYGNEDSQLQCSEHVTVVTRDDLATSYPGHDWKKDSFPSYRQDDLAYINFRKNSIDEIAKRKQPRDFLLITFGGNHKAISEAHKDMIVVEPGIGYPDGGFAPFRVFESYAVMHAYVGQDCMRTVSNNRWYDAVIPNYFDLNDFGYSETNDDYFLFLGRVYQGKGVHVAIQIAEELGAKLIVAGPGKIEQCMARTSRPISEYVTHVGCVGPDERRRLLSRAKAVICASTFLEPFCGVQIEGMLGGKPIISSDWGAFAEYNIHGVTGYRCRTFDQFVWAAKNIDKISPKDCRKWGENFSTERVGEMFEEFWQMAMDVHTGQGWYQQHPERANLDWLSRQYPDSKFCLT